MGYSTWGTNWGTYMGIKRSKRWGTIRVVDGFPSQMSGSGLGTDLSQGSLEVETAPG